MTPVRNLLSVIAVLIVLLLANMPLLLATLSPDPLIYTNIPYPLSQKVYRRDTAVVMSVGRCSNEGMPISVVSVKELYNPITGVIIPLPPGSGIIPPGCSSTQTAFGTLFPDGTPSGTYVIRGVTTMRGRFKTIDVAWQTQSFMYVGEE